VELEDLKKTLTHWVEWGKGITKERDDEKRREVLECCEGPEG
jgi:hypothetical protein